MADSETVEILKQIYGALIDDILGELNNIEKRVDELGEKLEEIKGEIRRKK